MAESIGGQAMDSQDSLALKKRLQQKSGSGIVEIGSGPNNAEPPYIPHITSNYIPMAQILSNLVVHSYNGLQNVIETLPSISSDLTRKRRLLDFVVGLRKELIKVYVLAKWAKHSADVSRCIDVVSWLHGQQNCFANVIEALSSIDHTMGGAKLRNPDIETALEVFTQGQPTQMSRNFLAPRPLSPRAILRTFHDLNILLSIRLSLNERLPPQYQDFRISDGRATFIVKDSYEAQIGIADDSVDARFFFIDFKLTFEGATSLNPQIKTNLERVSNDILSRKGLNELFDTLLKFTQNFKLSVIYKQVVDLSKGLWNGVLNHMFYPDKSLVALQYWPNRPGGKNIVEVGLLRNKQIGIRWIREGTVIQNHGLELRDDLNVEALIQEITERHIKYIVQNMYKGLQVLNVTLLASNTKIRVQLTATKFTIFTVDYLSGRAVLQNPNNLILSAERTLNEMQSPEVIIKLRQLSIQDEIVSSARAAGWMVNNGIVLSTDELKRHFGQDTKSVVCLRASQWPLKWFMLVSLTNVGDPKCWVGQLTSKDGSWTVQFLEPIGLINEDNYSYDLFDSLTQFITTRIMIQAICKELEENKVKFTLLKQAILVDLRSLLNASWAHSSLYIKLNSGKVLVQGRSIRTLSIDSVPSTDSSVNFNPRTGTFLLYLDYDGGSSLLPALSWRMQQIESVVKYIDLIKATGLKMVEVSMDRVVFSYGPSLQASLILEQANAVLELNEGNPHYIVLSYLQEILNREGLLPVLWVLRSALPFYQGLQGLPLGPVIIPQSVTQIQLVYWSEHIAIEMRLMRRKCGLLMYVSDTVLDSSTPPAALERLHELWSKIWPDTEVYPLTTGWACPLNEIAKVLTIIHNVIIKQD